MYILEKSEKFDTWLRKLKDLKAKAKILAKLKMAELGNLGNHKYIVNGLSEMIIDYGPATDCITRKEETYCWYYLLVEINQANQEILQKQKLQ